MRKSISSTGDSDASAVEPASTIPKKPATKNPCSDRKNEEQDGKRAGTVISAPKQ